MNPRTCSMRLTALLLACAALVFIAPNSGAGVTEAWVQRYNGPGNGDDGALFVAVDGDGNIVVTGYSNNGISSGIYTAKYAAATGALLWQRRYDIPESNASSSPQGLVLDSAGNALVAGDSWRGTNSEWYLAKYAAADGGVLWEKQFNNTGGGFGTLVAVDDSGNAILTMPSYGGDPADGGTGWDYYTAKCAAADGALLWAKRYNGPGNTDDQPTAVARDANGDVIVLGSTSVLKYAGSDGSLLWEHRYAEATAGNVPLVRVALDGSGNVVGIGTAQSNWYDLYTAKYSGTNGALLWEKSYDGPANWSDEPRAVAVDVKGDVVVTGYSSDPGGLNIYTAKYAGSSGALLWQKRYSKPGESMGGFAIAVDDTGNVGVTGGIRSNSGPPWDFYTAKYAVADGALLWEKRYNGPASGNDEPVWMLGGIAFGPNGMLVVAGYSENNSGSRDFITIVYRETLPPVTIAMDPGGVHLCPTGAPGRSYNIERAPGATGPWSVLATPTAPPGGLIEYTDTNPPAATAFYRTSAP
jgi:hypothetical protein